ncbi:MAG: tetratricopeptide repeat protein [Lachnospiraceae bacterium]|nr:tetratricopeptide repeat protein [Lachnospiraceae bacterium]
MKKNNVLIIALAAVAVVLVLAGVLIVAFFSGNTEKKYEKQMENAERYLNELDFKEAISAFKEAIGIDPKRPEAYAGLADLYAEQEDYDKAMKILEEGYDETGDESLADKLEKIKKKTGEDVRAADPTPTEAEEPAEPGDEGGDIVELPDEEAFVELLNCFAWHLNWDYQSEYDHTHPFANYPATLPAEFSYGTAIDWLMASIPCVPFEKYPIEQPIFPWSEDAEEDPLGELGGPCMVWDEESVDWILSNILNLSDEDIKTMKERWSDTSQDVKVRGYLHEGKYYKISGGVGGGYDARIVKVTTDGKTYTVTYELFEYFSEPGDGSPASIAQRVMTAEQKTIDGKQYWTILKDVCGEN